MADDRVLVTGSAGLIGRALVAKMRHAGIEPIGFDIRETSSPAFGDLRDHGALERALTDVAGIVHLGGVSRVIWGERSPELCWTVNVESTRKILDRALASRRRPWLVYASSREVYGQQNVFPVAETAQLYPMNAYARSKVAAEELVSSACAAGARTAIVRFSSVYGDVDDYPDRVVPAFALAATHGGTMRLDGPNCAFDFTHVDDVSAGVMKICSALSSGEKRLPTLHFVSGVMTTLSGLAELAAEFAHCPVGIDLAAPRAFDISEFCGDPARTAEVLGWRATTPLRAGVGTLIREFRTRSAMREDHYETNPVTDPPARHTTPIGF